MDYLCVHEPDIHHPVNSSSPASPLLCHPQHAVSQLRSSQYRSALCCTFTTSSVAWISHRHRPCPVTPNTQDVNARAHVTNRLCVDAFTSAAWISHRRRPSPVTPNTQHDDYFLDARRRSSRRPCRARRVDASAVIAAWTPVSGILVSIYGCGQGAVDFTSL
ncbi:hypothetical protein BD626DRAFT_170369 [Schizophyllum amplum]|uniref:Uncharacterized protein n=1 Tax=Schizophyllum amplum TaxID=97359 RepID=A0A550CQW6_9AGAR|nr:hypothetical protein BD626DRAFT_170369 [Auriculariopsis ampla]